MKIARPLPVSERHVEWYAPLPAPSLRELSSECETEGVYFDERNHSKISEPIKNCEETLGPVEPSDDTPSVTPFGRASSLREGAGDGPYHSTYRPKTGRLRAIFIAPTKAQKFLHSTVHRGVFCCAAEKTCAGGRNVVL